mgnify:CR=1 FL=1
MKKVPLFVIVGRANVGKSTLFNSIVGKNIAVTHSLPGVTRDVLKKRVCYEDSVFDICDTGGLFGPEDELKEKVKSKIFKIMDEADLYLFVVDAKDGLKEGDKEIMEILRKKNKPIYLLINKIDVKNKNIEEFYELGIPEERIYKISATHKLGISELIERLVMEFPCKETEEKRIPVTIIGRPNVGKSSLLNSLIGEDYAIVSPIPGTTRDPVEVFKDEFIFIDTAGIRKKFNTDLEYFSYIKTSHSIDYSLIVIFVMDIREPFTKIERKIFTLVEEKGKGIIVALNKIDLLKEKEAQKIYIELKDIYPYVSYVPFILISAKEKLGIDTLYLTIRSVWMEMNREIKKSLLKKFLKRVVKENSPPFFIKDIREKSKIPRVYEVISEDRLPPYYLRYLKNQFRKDFGLMGVPVKILNTLY